MNSTDSIKAPKFRIIGTGGAGISAIKQVAKLIDDKVQILAIDTDISTLSASELKHVCPIGGVVTDNLGCGGDAAKAKEAAIANLENLRAAIKNVDFLVIVTGLGGGTGSITAPMLTKLADESGVKFILSISVLPLEIEGFERSELAKKALAYMRKRCNVTIALPNDLILNRSNQSVEKVFEEANLCIAKAICTMRNMTLQNGIINIDLASLNKIFENKNQETFYAYAKADGENAIQDAIEKLFECPLMPQNKPLIAENALVHIRCAKSLDVAKMQIALEAIKEKLNVRSRIGFGVNTDEFREDVEICLIGTIVDPQIFESLKAEIEQTKDSSALSAEEASANTQILPPSEPIISQRRRRIIEQNTSQNQTITLPPTPAPTPDPRKVTPEEEEFSKTTKTGSSSKSFFKKNSSENDQQTEFKFMDKSQQRGIFDSTPPNIRGEEDLDVPTYLRRNVRIHL